MKKQITVFFEPVKLELEVDDNLDNEEIEQEITSQVYGVQEEDILAKVKISFWE